MSLREHIRLVGILNLVWSSLSIAVGLIVLLLFGGLAGFFAVIGVASPSDSSTGLLVGPFMAIIGFMAVILICFVSLPAFIGGIGLLRLKGWSRLLMIVVSVLHLVTFPVGTALGVYGIWVLFHEGIRQQLDGDGALSVPPPPDSPVLRA